MSAHRDLFILLVPLLVAAACGGTAPPVRVAGSGAPQAQPLGPSYVLLPLPSEDATLLGRILASPPDAERSLDEVSAPNPCLDHLADAETFSVSNSYENAEEIGVGGAAEALLGQFGFRGAASRATHFAYRLRVHRQRIRRDTLAYSDCCSTHDCGYGYVGALVYGTGDYAAAEESYASGSADFAVARMEGDLRLRYVQRRQVTGWFAAVIRTTGSRNQSVDDWSTPAPLGVDVSAIDLSTSPEGLRSLYDRHKMGVCASDTSRVWRFCDRAGPVSENEFARRYTHVTASDELVDVVHQRNPWAAWRAAVLIPTSAATAALAVHHYDDEEKPWVGYLTVGFFAGVLGLHGLAEAVVDYDGDRKGVKGSHRDHILTEVQGRRYADQYNRALVRYLMHESVPRPLSSSVGQPFSAGSEMEIILAPGGVGITTHF